MISFHEFQLKQLENIIDNGIKYFKHQLTENQNKINISNEFVNNIFKYYNDFIKKKYCFDATKLLINEFINNEVNNIKSVYKQQIPTENKKTYNYTLSTIETYKLNKIRQQKREYYLRNKNKFKEYKKENNNIIKEYQKNYRNKNKNN